MNFFSRILLLTLALIMFIGLACQAKLEFGGNIFAEFKGKQSSKHSRFLQWAPKGSAC